MTVAFVITTAEAEVASNLWSDQESPRMDGNLFRFTRADVSGALGKLTALAATSLDADEARAAMRLAERLGGWLGKNGGSVTPEIVIDLPPETLAEIESNVDAAFAQAERSTKRKGKRPAASEPVEVTFDAG